MISVEECVRLEENGLYEYVKGSNDWMLKELVQMRWVLKKQEESRDDYRKRKEREREGKDWMRRCSMGSFFAR